MEQAIAGGKSRIRKAGEFIAEEFVHALPAMVFFALGFNLIVFSINLVLSQYFLRFGSFMLATTAALVVGKAVLVADSMPFLRRFESAPLIQPILFKTCVYTVFVFIARLIEAYVHYMIDTGRLIGFFPFMYEQFSWQRFIFIQLWIFVLFFIYTTGSELNRLFGYGMLAKLFFKHRSSEYKLSRRERIRTLVRLSRVTERHTIDELGDPHTAAHHEMVGLLRILADRKPGRPATAARLSAARPTAPTIG
jgi:hypothetical protein